MFNNKTVERKYIRLYGKVHSVGLRARAEDAAAQFELTGWFRNEGEDSVSMELQGTKKNIKKFIAYLEDGPKIRIENIKSKDIEPLSDETSFRMIT